MTNDIKPLDEEFKTTFYVQNWILISSIVLETTALYTVYSCCVLQIS